MKTYSIVNQNSVMEARDHFKNGANSKSQMTRRNFFRNVSYAIAALTFCGCEDLFEDDETGSSGKNPNICANLQYNYNSAKANLKSAEQHFERLQESGSSLAMTQYRIVLNCRELVAHIEKQARENGCTLK